MATNEPMRCSEPGCGALMRRERPAEHPTGCPGLVGPPDHYTGICQRNGKPYRVHWICSQIGDHRVSRPIS